MLVFNRIILPIILVLMLIVTMLLVMNAFEATNMMKESGLASPTMLNERPE